MRKHLQIYRFDADCFTPPFCNLSQSAKRIIKYIANEYSAKTCHVSPNGNYLAVGCVNGRVYIYDPNSLKKISEIKDIIDPDKETLSIVKFSPNNEFLGVGYCPP